MNSLKILKEQRKTFVKNKEVTNKNIGVWTAFNRVDAKIEGYELGQKELMDLLFERIKSCYESLLFAKDVDKYKRAFYKEGFRCRLDELILYYHLVKGISFVEACKELNINYEDLDALQGVSDVEK